MTGKVPTLWPFSLATKIAPGLEGCAIVGKDHPCRIKLLYPFKPLRPWRHSPAKLMRHTMGQVRASRAFSTCRAVVPTTMTSHSLSGSTGIDAEEFEELCL